MNAAGRIKFSDGKHVTEVIQALYLGVLLHHKADAKVEIADRIKQAMATWKGLHKFWKMGKCTQRRKLQVWTAVVRSKLTYGMQTIHLDKDQLAKLDAFQAKGIRKILGWKATYVERANTNKKLRREATRILNKDRNKDRKGNNKLEKASTIVKDMQLNKFGHLLREPYSEPTREATFHHNLLPKIGEKRRVGRPRNN